MDKQVKISIQSHGTLTALAAKKDRSLKDFLEQCINYFKVTELDPNEIDADGIRVEIKKLDRRIVSFFKTQEKEKIAPILDELSIISKTISQSLTTAPSKKDFATLTASVKENIQNLIVSHNQLATAQRDGRVKDLEIIRQKAKRLFNEYIEEVESKSTLASRKPIDDKFKKLFETI